MPWRQAGQSIMIISDEHRFAFVHVPKCAGTSVKSALRAIDSTAGRFERIADHPAMGMTHCAHIPLRDLAAFFPSDFRKVRDYRSLALVREPTERFVSAIFQQLREFKHYPQSGITGEVVAAEAEAVMRYLAADPARLDLEHVHFNRQTDFIELEGQRIVKRILSIERMADAVSFIAESTGVSVGGEHENRTTELRFRALRPVQRLLRRPYALVPQARRQRIRDGFTRAGLYRGVAKQQFVRRGGVLEGFLHDYYARDFALYAESR